MARSEKGGHYPVGTIIQLVPGEAMVKRAPGFIPAADPALPNRSATTRAAGR